MNVLSVILVNYFSEKHIAELVDQLSGPGIEFVIADNSQTLDHSKNVRKNIIVIDMKQNTGFAAAVNAASKLASGEYLLILNPDVRLNYETVKNLLKFARENPNYGFVAPKLREMKQSGSFLNGGKFPYITSMFLHFSGISRFSSRFSIFSGFLARDSKAEELVLEVDWVSGAAFIISKSLFLELEGFSERWFMYSEDIEICFRARKLGKKAVIVRNLRGVHYGQESDTRNQLLSNTDVRWLLNLADFYYKDIAENAVIKLFVWWVILWFGFAARVLVFSLLSLFDINKNSLFADKRKKMKSYLSVSASQLRVLFGR